MNIALISDIHGNLIALDAVLAALESHAVDQILCLGDISVLGPHPRETLARIRDLDCLVVMGNTDAWTLNPQPHTYRDADTPPINAIELWGAQQLTEHDRTFIATFPDTLMVDLPNAQTLCGVHGSPRAKGERILSTTPEAALNDIVDTCHASTILAAGHTHIQMLRRFRDMILINPGSVGYPVEIMTTGEMRHPPWAEYAIITANAAGALHIALCRVPVDTRAIIKAARSSEMPYVEWWITPWHR